MFSKYCSKMFDIQSCKTYVSCSFTDGCWRVSNGDSSMICVAFPCLMYKVSKIFDRSSCKLARSALHRWHHGNKRFLVSALNITSITVGDETAKTWCTKKINK
jgi:hypothetical protein